jgi:hypothetical protein
MQNYTEKPKLDSLQIGILFLILGITLFIISVFSGSQIISLIGLGLAFWGALFLLIPPPKNVDASFLINSSLPNYMTIDRMLNYLYTKNEGYNIPPCPRDIYLPQHLEGLKEMVTFIPAEHTNGIAEIEDIARGNFLIEQPKGLLIASPGLDLLDKIEQKYKIDFTKISLSELYEKLPYLLSELNLAKEIEMTTNENNIILQINDSLYKNLYSQKYKLKSINILGCPLVNAATCATAKSAGKPTMIQEIKTTPNGKTTIVTFKIINKTFEKRQKLIEDIGKVDLRKNELLVVLNASIDIVDLMFDILVGLQKKRVNWQLLEDCTKGFGADLSFTGQTMPSLNLNLQKISSLIKRQLPKETSKEAYMVLKIINEYFESLNLNDEIKESVPNFLEAKAIILSYYTLNDLLLGKVVGDKENKKEINQLVSVLQILTNNTEFKVNIEKLKNSIDEVVPESNLESEIDNCREIFKEQLKQMSSINPWIMSEKKA